MKKVILFTIFALSFYDNLSAQFTTNTWYGPYWGWVEPNSNDYSSDLYRQGSLTFRAPWPWDGFGIQNKGIKFFDYGNDIHWQWRNTNYGLTIADFNSTNVSLSNDFNFNNTATALSGYGGLSFTTMNGAMFMHQNGIVSIGLNINSQHGAKRRELSLKSVDSFNGNTGYSLYVRGGIVAERMKVALIDNWPDYVFKKDYTLTPLSMVESHIKEKGYLHKSKSAEQMEKDGIEVAETAKAQQEKIEELFLHLIDMDKRLKAVEAENAQLKADLNNNKK